MEIKRNGFITHGMPHISEDSFRSALQHDFGIRSKTWSIEIDSLDYAMRLDKDDPLRDFRKRFYYPKKKNFPEVDQKNLADDEEECIYFCGHSLGLQLKSVEDALHEVLKNWAERGVESHFGGFLPAAFCDLPLKENMAYLVGAKASEVALLNGLTVNIHIMMSSFYQPTAERHKIFMVENGFHSDLYAVQSQIKLRGYDPKESIIFLKPRKGEHLINPKDIISVIEEHGKSISLIFLEGVHFYTGQFFDIRNITREGHRQGCVVGFDLAHAVGNVKLQLHDWEVDFALWCTYKYLNSGAGSMGCIYVHERHTNGYNEIIPMMQGWWGVSNAEKFSLQREFIPADGADRFKISNPSPFLSAMVLVNLEVFREAGIERLQEKQKLLTGYLEYLLKKHFPPSNGIESGKPHIQVITPSNPKRRGCQISIMSSGPITEIDERLKAKGIVCDIRKPSVMRVTPVPLYNSFTEVYKFVHILEGVIDEISWQNGQQN